MRLGKRVEDAETRLSALDSEPAPHGRLRLLHEIGNIEIRLSALDSEPVLTRSQKINTRLSTRLKNIEARLTALEA